MTRHSVTLLFMLALAFGCQSPDKDQSSERSASIETTDTVNRFSFQWDALADKVIDRTKLQPGEKVLIVGSPGAFDAMIQLLRTKVVARGGLDLGAISVTQTQPASWATEYTNGAEGKNQRELEEYFRELDLGIMMPGAVPSDLAYRSIQNILDGGTRRTIHFHWAGAYATDMEEMPLSDEINATYQRAILETDYDRLNKLQSLLERDMRAGWTRVTNEAGTDIRFRIGDRPFTKQDGDASAVRMAQARNLIDREIELPAGAIRVAPIESTVNGTIAFPDADWNGTFVHGLVVTMENGKVTRIEAAEGKSAVEEELEKGQLSSFREFAMGLNPLLAIPQDDPWIPYYGYGAGVVRLSLGDNTELGGEVGGGLVRWNFFTDATVTVGEEIWIRRGLFAVE